MSLLSSVSNAIGKATSVVKKIAASPIGSAAIGMMGPIGSVANAALAVSTVKDSKQQVVTQSTNVPTASSSKNVAVKSEQEQTMMGKIKDFYLKNKKNILIGIVILIVMALVYFFLFAKKSVRRKSPRRVSQAARMRAAKAAKRKR